MLICILVIKTFEKTQDQDLGHQQVSTGPDLGVGEGGGRLYRPTAANFAILQGQHF